MQEKNIELQENNINLIKISEINPDCSNIIIDRYIPFIIKQNIIENILDACTTIDEESGFKRVDSALKRMVIEFSIVNQITNIDFSEPDSLESYDILKANGVINYILKNINPDEIEFIYDCVNEQIEEIYKVDNSLQSIVSQGLNKLLEKIPDNKKLNKFVKEFFKQLDKLDPEKLKFVKDIVKWDEGKGGNNA